MANPTQTTTPGNAPAAGDVLGPPIHQPQTGRELAPWPQIDRYPTIIGQGLSLQYVASVSRLCLVGYRQQYVDMLDELLEKDGHLFSVLQKRILAVAGAKIEFTPPKGVVGDGEKKLAQAIADFCNTKILAIPNLKQHIAWLMWSVWYSLTALEIHWERKGSEWSIGRLSGIQSRRLAYPDQNAWDLYVWDQGNVLSPFVQTYGQAPTQGVYGLRVADYPGKFVIHTPMLRGDYPTRDGLGRQLATWVVLKLIATRGASQYLERFGKPWPEVSYVTEESGKPRAASDDEIEAAKAAANALGIGSLSSWVHPDCVTLDLRTPDQGSAPKITFEAWLSICNGEESKATIGGTLTTDVGKSGGNRALGDTQKKGELTIEEYDASCLAETFKRDVVYWLVKLNFGERGLSLMPEMHVHVEDQPEPNEIIARAEKLVNMGAPVDADALADEVGTHLVSPGDTTARRLFRSDFISPAVVDPDLAKKVEELTPEVPEADAGGRSGGGKAPGDDDVDPEDKPPTQ